LACCSASVNDRLAFRFPTIVSRRRPTTEELGKKSKPSKTRPWLIIHGLLSQKWHRARIKARLVRIGLAWDHLLPSTRSLGVQRRLESRLERWGLARRRLLGRLLLLRRRQPWLWR
jgi:hypothetical protein